MTYYYDPTLTEVATGRSWPGGLKPSTGDVAYAALILGVPLKDGRVPAQAYHLVSGQLEQHLRLVAAS